MGFADISIKQLVVEFSGLDILSFIHEITKDTNVFTSHPIKELSVKDRLLYLNGLALVMNADGTISEPKKDYLSTLIKSFDFDLSLLERFITFAGSPDKNTVLLFFQTFGRKSMAQLFLFDAYMLVTQDSDIHDKSLAVVDKMADHLEVMRSTRRDIFDLVCCIRNRDWSAAQMYFSTHLLNPAHYQHLLEYYEVDLDTITSTQTVRLREKFYHALGIQWTPLIYTNDECLPQKTAISKEFVGNIPVANQLIIPFLQAKLERGELVVVEGNVHIRTDDDDKPPSFDNPYFSLHESSIFYDPLTRVFWVPLDKATRPTQLPKTVVMDFLCVVLAITEDSIGFGKKWSEYDDDICFPAFLADDDSFLEGEIVKGYDGRFYQNEGVDSYTNLGANVMNISFEDVIKSGKFRLTR